MPRHDPRGDAEKAPSETVAHRPIQRLTEAMLAELAARIARALRPPREL